MSKFRLVMGILIVITYLLTHDMATGQSLSMVEVYLIEIIIILIVSIILFLIVGSIVYIFKKFGHKLIKVSYKDIFILAVLLSLILYSFPIAHEALKCSDLATFARGIMPGWCYHPRIINWYNQISPFKFYPQGFSY